MDATPLTALRCAAILLVSVSCWAGPSRPSTQTTDTGSRFELIPRAFQSNARLDMTVLTEMTEPGRKLPEVSPQKPAYYLLAPGKYRPVHESAGTEPPKAEEIEKVLRESLHFRGYEPATTAHPATLLIVYSWGPHMFYDGNMATYSEQALLRNTLDRAVLVGGEKFANALAKAVADRSDMYAASAAPLASQMAQRGLASDSDTSFDLGAAAGLAEMNAKLDPVRRFVAASVKNEFLVTQASSDCYYLVASAYDYASVGKNQRQLLWRTQMTVGADGVSQTQALPPLIANASQFLGREMAEPETLSRRLLRHGQVEMGTPTPVDDPVPTTKR